MNESPPQPTHALRFRRSQARTLEGTAKALDADGFKDMGRLVRSAAKAARAKQPLPLKGTAREVEEAAERFASMPGVVEPDVVVLGGVPTAVLKTIAERGGIEATEAQQLAGMDGGEDVNDAELETVKVTGLDTGIGREAGYESDADFIEAANAERAKLPEDVRALLDQVDAELERRVLFGKGADRD